MLLSKPRLLTTNQVGYDEGPHYAWDSTLTFEKLAEEISKINRVEGLVYGDNLEQYDLEIPEFQEPRWRRAEPGKWINDIYSRPLDCGTPLTPSNEQTILKRSRIQFRQFNEWSSWTLSRMLSVQRETLLSPYISRRQCLQSVTASFSPR